MNFEETPRESSSSDCPEGLPQNAPILSGADASVSDANFFEVYQQVINGLPEDIALLDDQWNIVAVNDSWRKTTTLLGYPLASPGKNYLDFCKHKASTGYTPAALVAKGIEEIERGIRSSFRFTYQGRDRWEGRTFEVRVSQIRMLGRTYATATRHDITELIQLRHLREDFSHRCSKGRTKSETASPGRFTILRCSSWLRWVSRLAN